MLTLTTDQPTFRLIVEGDRFPHTITQPYGIPDEGGELDVSPVYSPRAEGAEHTWPLPMVATALGYGSTLKMLADNKAAIRLLTYGSSAEGSMLARPCNRKWRVNCVILLPANH